jgi:hypothetical protein
LSARAKDWLLGQQHPDGYWCGELEADSMLEADYIFMHTLLGTGDPARWSARSTRFCATRMKTAAGASIPAARQYLARREVLLRAEADGLVAGASGAGEGA